MSGGRKALRASAMRPGSIERVSGRAKLHTCPAACTPASVRPLPVTRAATPKARRRAPSSSPCTVRPFFWICQPHRAVPS